MADALDGVASVAAARGQAERAARLHGAAATLRERLGAQVAPWERPAHEREVAAVRAALGDGGVCGRLGGGGGAAAGGGRRRGAGRRVLAAAGKRTGRRWTPRRRPG